MQLSTGTASGTAAAYGSHAPAATSTAFQAARHPTPRGVLIHHAPTAVGGPKLRRVPGEVRTRHCGQGTAQGQLALISGTTTPWPVPCSLRVHHRTDSYRTLLNSLGFLHRAACNFFCLLVRMEPGLVVSWSRSFFFFLSLVVAHRFIHLAPLKLPELKALSQAPSSN